jgi:outer membrane immunogenic protein
VARHGLTGAGMKKLLTLAAALALSAPVTAFAADLPQPPPPLPPAPVFVPPPFTWSGIYVGGNIGWGWTNVTFTDTGPAPYGFGQVFPLGNTQSAGQNGFLGGAQIGVNWQFQQFVVGAEADFDATAINNTQNGSPGSGSYSNPWMSTFAARFGWAADRTLFYGKAGGAYMQEKLSSGDPDGSTATGTFNRWGWMAGAGVEYAVTGNITLKAEYNYLDFGSQSQTLTPNATDLATQTITFDSNSSKLTANVVKVGVNVLFH